MADDAPSRGRPRKRPPSVLAEPAPRVAASRARWRDAAVLVAIVAVGALLRMLPRWRGGDVALLSDAAFHLRMTVAALSGGVPRIDALADAPQGRAIAELLPTAFYPLAAAFHRVASLVDRGPIEEHARWFVALAGALVALPAYGGARVLFRRSGPALLAAALAVLIPGHLHRTFGYWYRYEALGTLLITTHVALALAALAAPARGRRLAFAVGSGLAIVAALAVWRVAFMIPLLETGFVIAYLLVRPPDDAIRDWFAVLIAFGTMACLGLGYLRDQSFALSGAWLVAMLLALALWAPPLRSARASRFARMAALAAVVAAALLASRFSHQDRQYTQIADAVTRKAATAFGVTPAPPPPLTLLAMRVEELEGSSLGGVLGPGVLSWIGMLLLAAPLLYARRARWRPGLAPAPALFAVLVAALFAITLLVVRNKVLLAPLAAVAVAGLLPAFRARAARATPARKPLADAVLVVALAAGSILTARDAVTLATTRASSLEPGLDAALAFLARETPPGTIVLAPWERGYEVQSLAGRPTLVDGLLEDPVTQQRIVRIARAWMAPATDSLAALCREHRATHLLVPPSSYLYAIAMLTDWPAAAKVRDGVPLTPAEADRVLVRMMVLGESPAPFERVLDAGGWRVYRVANGPEGRAAP